jgi:hypothetical protein
MSFLVTRGLSSINKSTADPKAEKELREQQKAAKQQIREFKTKIADERNTITPFRTKKLIHQADYDALMKMLDEMTTFLDADATLSLTKDDITDKWEDTFNANKYNALVLTAFQPGSYKNATGGRFQVQTFLKLFKQMLHDNSKFKPETKKITENAKADVEKFLAENLYSVQKSYDVFISQHQTEYNEDMSNKEFAEALQAASAKLAKNNTELDWAEHPGAPVAGAAAQDAAAKAEKFVDDAEKDTFDVMRLLKGAAGKATSYVVIALVIFMMLLGSSMAVNLNMYRPTGFKVLYAIYGAIFAFVVIPYVILYRWAWKKQQPRYYGFLPFVPKFFVTPWVHFVLGWLTYIPDDHMKDTMEWIHESNHESK